MDYKYKYLLKNIVINLTKNRRISIGKNTVVRRQGLEEAQSKSAGRRTGTGFEVWYTRDEWARDHEVLHPRLGCAL